MKILFLSTWFPYPPDQGCKIRAYHLLKALAERHETVLLSFQDGAIEPAWLEHLGGLCKSVEVVGRDPFAAEPNGRVRGWLSLKPSSVVATHSAEMARRARALAAGWRPDRIVALTFVTAPYALAAGQECRQAACVVDVDNLLTRMLQESYQQAGSAVSRLRRGLAWWKFRRYERRLYGSFDLCLTVSELDRRTLLGLLSRGKGRVEIAPNGVDADHNRPGLAVPEADTLVYNGALTYSANYEAMEYFLGRVFPRIRAHVPGARLRITGKTEGVALERLGLNTNVTFTGYLKDARPVVAGSWACVAPLLNGGGSRVKILEAMALGTPVVSTPKGAEGLEVTDGRHLLLADSPDRFAGQTARLLRDPGLRTALAAVARRLVVDRYQWGDIGPGVCGLVENCRRS